MHGKHPASAPHGAVIGARRRRLQQRLAALHAGLRVALRALRSHPIKHPQR